MSQKKINWTTQQSRAIEEHRRDVFVSASAGTGKTAVLSGSCVDVVKNVSACPDVWSILVVTFTDMAAEQMRSRIAQQLNSAIEISKEPALRQHLRRQLILLGAADVSTIHAFCKRLITGHFYKLDLDPTFGIIDADEAKRHKAEVLEKTIDYGWKQSNLADALRQLFNRRDLRTNEGFPARIIEINDFLDGVVSRDDWLARAQMLAESTNPFATDLAESQKQIVAEQLQNAVSRLNSALKIYQANNPAGKWVSKYENDYIRPVEQLLEWLKAGRWDTAAAAISGFERPTVYVPKDVPPALGELIGKMVRTALDSVKGLKDLAILNPGYLNKFAGAVSLQTMVLVELVRQFDRLYTQAKKAINCLDFADLEHYALRLLTTQKSSGEKLKPSETALALRQKYKYVFVDECQDINHVQQTILDMVSSPGNVFAVGDPKQSIYRWRGARPEIFLEHLKRASSRPEGKELGLRVDLNVNFRSVKPILDFVNLVFGRIMTASFTSIDYDASAHLQPAPGNADSATTGPAVELHILDKMQTDADSDYQQDEERPDSQSAQPFTDRQLQAAMIARRIKQMVGADVGKPLHILDKQTGSSRPIEYRDIVILMRSLAGKNDFVETLRLSGIPVSCEATAGYFEATEITDMLSLLKVLDNPRRDIELAAVLRCPFFGFTDSELAGIRLWGKKDNRKLCFYDCVLGCSQSADDRELADKLTTAIASLENWRTIARRGRIAELIWHIYRQTGFLSFVCALPDGPARRANLLKLHDRAIQFEGFAGNAGVPSLTRFIEFVEKLLSAGQDWAPAEPESAAGNAVRILSVHKSKGLEFPVVFVADLDNQFSKKDSRQDCLVDEQSTLGLRVIDADGNSRLDSLAYQVIEQHARRNSLAEEMRILYVAMTRAMDRLILVGCKDKKSCQNVLTTSFLFSDQPVPHWHLETCRSHLDWILCALSNHPRLHQAFQTALPTHTSNDNLFHVQLYAQPELAQLSALVQHSTLNTQHSKLNTQASAYDLARLKQSLNWQYSYGHAPLLPAKRTVSQWTHRNDEFTKIDYSMSLSRMPKVILSAERIDGRSIGTATHLVLSQIDLNKPLTTEIITRLIDKLLAEGAMTRPVASQIDAESILKFFKSDLGRMALDRNNLVSREWPFTFAIPASQWVESAQRTNDERRATSDDTIIVQGIIDLLIKTPKGLLVVDFKTDDVSAKEAPHRTELYRPQLDLYARAAAAITGQNVLSKWLCFLSPGCTIELTSAPLTGNQ
jgi:ATP-dependent helicase/nuclease subunit A